MVVVGLQLQMSLVGALFFDVVCGYALLAAAAAAATHTCLFFCSDPFSTHTDTHTYTHTPTHIFQRITLPSHPKRSFPSLLIRFCFMTRIFTVGLISRAQSRQGPCERALLLHQGLFLLPRPVLALETEHVPTLGCPETRNNQRHRRASRTMCTSSSPFRFGLRVPISG